MTRTTDSKAAGEQINIRQLSRLASSRPLFHLEGLNWLYILKVTGLSIAVILAATVILVVEQSRRIAAGLTVWDCPIPGRTPAQVGLANYEVAQIQLQSDEVLTAWYVPSQNGAAVLLLQGHWAARDGMLNEAAMLARHGYGVMLLDPHPCAKPGLVHTLGNAEVKDVAAAVRFLRQQPDVLDGRIGLLGFSIGGVIALQSAAEVPEVRAVVAEGNFDRLTSGLIRDRPASSLAQGLTRYLVLLFYRYYTGLDPALVAPIDAAAKISPRPILFIAGEGEIEDNHTLAQFDAAGEPKELWIVSGVGHGGYQDRWPAEYEQRVINFFDQFLVDQIK